MNSLVDFQTPWSKLSAREFDSWHSMCSYLGSFPPALASYFINYFSAPGDLILDPFSGRGTTLLEARILNRVPIATDLNPIAIALTEAKNVNISQEQVLSRIDELERKYDYALYQPEAMAQDDEIHLIFNPRTLAQLCYLRRRLLKSENDIDKYLIGCCLGILHGSERVDGTSGYASIDMPNTFSMSPHYVRRFVQTKQLSRTFRDVFVSLREKTQRLYKKHNETRQKGIVLKGDVKLLSEIPELKSYYGKANLVLTSPPYLGIVNYAKQNWIRLWFLNQNPKDISNDLDDDLNLEEWLNFSKTFIEQVQLFLKDDGVAVFVIGDVAKSKTSIIPLAREFAMMIYENRFFNNVWCINDTIIDKTTRIWGETKGSATATDRIIVLSNINPFKKFENNIYVEPLNYEFVKESTRFFVGEQIFQNMLFKSQNG
ncbi:MAG TPA: DNA methyltransferase [Pyrinomonadaceae bacterium]|jgi:site-specific DNA-methyltransferase (adenine-specific)